jgi:hypothetical protein
VRVQPAGIEHVGVGLFEHGPDGQARGHLVERAVEPGVLPDLPLADADENQPGGRAVPEEAEAGLLAPPELDRGRVAPVPAFGSRLVGVEHVVERSLRGPVDEVEEVPGFVADAGDVHFAGEEREGRWRERRGVEDERARHAVERETDLATRRVEGELHTIDAVAELGGPEVGAIGRVKVPDGDSTFLDIGEADIAADEAGAEREAEVVISLGWVHDRPDGCRRQEVGEDRTRRFELDTLGGR